MFVVQPAASESRECMVYGVIECLSPAPNNQLNAEAGEAVAGGDWARVGPGHCEAETVVS